MHITSPDTTPLPTDFLSEETSANVAEDTSRAVCVVGVGPRGLCVLERLLANERAWPRHSALTVHLVDPHAPGAGAVWRTDQNPLLLMNTVASQVTIFTDASCRISGPVMPGPSLYEWAKSLPEDSGMEADLLAEAKSLKPDGYPSRAFYGHYLREMFGCVVAGAPAHVTVRVHRLQAVALEDAPGTASGLQIVRLEDGTRLTGLHAVVLAQGHVPTELSPEEQTFANAARELGLTYVTPSNPADTLLEEITPGETVILRGMGLNFFDYMTLFTRGRGGFFSRSDDGRLVYWPSGREPLMYAFSRRGVPYHARGENQKGPSERYLPSLLTPERITRLRSRDGQRIRFRKELWPLISREVESVYYAALLASRGGERDNEELRRCYLETDDVSDRDALLDAYGIDAAERWDWQAVADPCARRSFHSPNDFTVWLTDHLRQDVREARRGNVRGPLKAALDVLRDLRNEVRLAVDHCGLDGQSHKDELDAWYTPLNAFLSIGPPASRIEEMLALMEAELLHVLGPGTKVSLDPGGCAFTARSTQVPGSEVRASVLIEARLPVLDIRRTCDPLLRGLSARGELAPHRIPIEGAEHYETGGVAVEEGTYRLLDSCGRSHPRRLIYGVPTESVHWVRIRY